MLMRTFAVFVKDERVALSTETVWRACGGLVSEQNDAVHAYDDI